MRHGLPLLVLALSAAAFLATSRAEEPPGDDAPAKAEEGNARAEALIRDARQALREGREDAALALATRAVEAAPGRPEPYLARAELHAIARRHEESLADCDRALELRPRLAEAYNARGDARFKLGRFREAVADYDRFIELVPSAAPGHWKRGLACYYAGRYADGRKQFEGYQTVDASDVENVVWRAICMAREKGFETARREFLDVGRDPRVPMREIYALFQGTGTPDDILAAAQRGEPPSRELRTRLFYAHLYIGLYHEAAGDREAARRHIDTAAKRHVVPHFMGDVALVHSALFAKGTEKPAPPEPDVPQKDRSASPAPPESSRR